MRLITFFILLICSLSQPVQAETNTAETTVKTVWQCAKIGTGIYLLTGWGIPCIVIGLNSHSALATGIGGVTSYMGYKLMYSGLDELENLYEIKEQESHLSKFEVTQ